MDRTRVLKDVIASHWRSRARIASILEKPETRQRLATARLEMEAEAQPELAATA